MLVVKTLGTLVRIPIAVLKHYDQKELGERVYFSLKFHITVHYHRTSGQEFGGRS